MRCTITKPGCLTVAAALLLGTAWAVLTDPTARVVATGLAAGIPLSMLFDRWRVHRAAQQFRRIHSGEGRDLLIVYSDSPHWKRHIESRWLERWSGRVVTLNRSDPQWRARPEAALWRRVAGFNEHTPTAIVVPERGKPHVVRFYAAFRDNKHGKPKLLQDRERDLELRLAAARASH